MSSLRLLLLLLLCLLFLCLIERESACLPPLLSWGSSSRCPNQSSICIVLSDVAELARVCVAVTMRLYTRSILSLHFLLLLLLSGWLYYVPPLLLDLFLFLFDPCLGLLHPFFGDAVCPLSLSHPPHTFMSSRPFIRPLCSGRSFRPFFFSSPFRLFCRDFLPYYYPI